MRVRIENALGNCKYSQKCKCETRDSFESLNAEEFFIYDEKDEGSENPVRIVDPGKKYQLTVKNENKKEICLVKSDKCLFTDDTKKCDCLLFDNAIVYFIEIKTSSSSQRSKRRKDAREQLGTTINIFMENSVDLSGYKLAAVICFSSMEPRIINSASNSAKATFYETYKVKLYEMNVVSF